MNETSLIDISKYEVSKKAIDKARMLNNHSSLTDCKDILYNWDVSNIPNISSLFKNCSSLTNLDLSKWDVSNVTAVNNPNSSFNLVCLDDSPHTISDLLIKKRTLKEMSETVLAGYQAFADWRHIAANKEWYLSRKKDEVKRFTLTKLPSETSFFKVGKQYYLAGNTYDGIESKKLIYEVVKVIDKYLDFDLKSIIVRPIDIDNTMPIFSLTRKDCAEYGVVYEPNLQLFSQSLNWQEFKEGEENKVNPSWLKSNRKEENKVVDLYDLTREYNPDDMSTYPCDYRTMDVRQIILRFDSRRTYTYLKSRSMDVKSFYREFLNRLKIYPKNNRTNPYRFDVVTSMHTYNPSKWEIVDDYGQIYLGVWVINNNEGLKLEYLQGKKISDVLDVIIEKDELVW